MSVDSLIVGPRLEISQRGGESSEIRVRLSPIPCQCHHRTGKHTQQRNQWKGRYPLLLFCVASIIIFSLPTEDLPLRHAHLCNCSTSIDCFAWRLLEVLVDRLRLGQSEKKDFSSVPSQVPNHDHDHARFAPLNANSEEISNPDTVSRGKRYRSFRLQVTTALHSPWGKSLHPRSASTSINSTQPSGPFSAISLTLADSGDIG